jgi:hypothetical protein
MTASIYRGLSSGYAVLPKSSTLETPADIQAAIQLTAASLFSIIALAFTMVLHCFTGLHPRTNLALNGFNALLWTLSWSLLTWYMSPTLRNMCDVEHWQEDTGIMVCQIYKTLFTFTLLGL